MRGLRKINSHNLLQRLLIVKVGCMLKIYEDNENYENNVEKL